MSRVIRKENKAHPANTNVCSMSSIYFYKTEMFWGLCGHICKVQLGHLRGPIIFFTLSIYYYYLWVGGGFTEPPKSIDCFFFRFVNSEDFEPMLFANTRTLNVSKNRKKHDTEGVWQ